MSVTINGTTGVSKIQDGVIETADLIDATVTPAKLAQPFSAGTAVASTSGTSIDFTSIPSWVKRITVMLDGVSLNGSSNILIQLGDSGGIETTGYVGGTGRVSTAVGIDQPTNGFQAYLANAARGNHGFLELANLNGNTWTCSGNFYTTANINLVAGTKTLSDILTQIRFTTANGTDTFDAGSINILYE